MIEKEKRYLRMMEENRERIFKIASVYSNTPEDRLDLIQEIAYQTWKSFDTYRAESSRSTWLYRIAINTALQFLKKRKRVVTNILPTTTAFSLPHSEQDHALAEKTSHLMQAIQQLKQLDKAIILLHLEEKSHKEIAEIVSLSTSNVGTRIQRIKERLKKMLKNTQDGNG
jgi:RNA polymerase sigma factor (sigma-70 family)